MSQIVWGGELMPAAGLHIKGAGELEAALLEVRNEVLRELRPALREIGEVIRADAQQRAGAEISHIGPQWGRMRLGLTVKGAYVAPRSRRHGGSPRPNLAGLLMDKAMQPALDAKQNEVMRRLDELVAVSAHKAGF